MSTEDSVPVNDTEQEIRDLIDNVAKRANVSRRAVSVSYRCWGDDDTDWRWSVYVELKVRTLRGQRKDRLISATGASRLLDEAAREALEDVEAYRTQHRRVTS